MVTVGSVNSEEPFELDLVNDNLALEFKETLLLNFTVNSASQVLVGLAQLAGEFIRSSAIVSITDNDGKTARIFFLLIWLISIESYMTS